VFGCEICRCWDNVYVGIEAVGEGDSMLLYSLSSGSEPTKLMITESQRSSPAWGSGSAHDYL
jgi:hypothetical protein